MKYTLLCTLVIMATSLFAASESIKAADEQQLKAFSSTAYPKQVTEVIPNKVYHVMGYAHSNASFIIGDTSVIVIDTLDSTTRAEQLKKIIATYTNKPIKTIIYTHGHPDHRGGAGAFMNTKPEIIAAAPIKPLLGKTNILKDVFDLRSIRQHGYQLTDEEAVSQGIGIREGITQKNGDIQRFVPPTTLLKERQTTRVIDGITFEFNSASGETDDHLLIWLPESKVLLSGDNYYGCWPNIAPIRGGQYRDVNAWIETLEKMLSFNATYVLPGHTKPLMGNKEVTEVLTNYHDALEYVLQETLKYINQDMSVDGIVEKVKLPEHFAKLPYLGEYYGTVEWTVRGIFSGYVGWFDGNPTNIHPLPPKDHAQKTIALMGGSETVQKAMIDALSRQDSQWAIELADLLLAIDTTNQTIKRYKAQGLISLAQKETSANSRHYYFAYAKELLSE
ncbi:alkyl/aryl-sulfatase [Sulfurospirillum sp.]|uniref:alkyl/aryl-sulfatase n=1 Tax=Sulfurospirillum sp. TaxID=2053622 RepID=UPI002FDD57DB